MPPPRPAALPIVHEPLRVHLHIHNHVITSAQISFHAPYPVTNADERYSVMAPVCHRGLAGEGSRANVARGALVTIPVGGVLSDACSRAVKFTIEYVSFAGGLPQPTPLGSITIHEPPGTHPVPLPRSVVEQERRSHPTRSLHATIHLTLLPQPRAACNAAFLLHPCYKGEVGFTAPYAVTSAAAGYSRATEYSIDGFATCEAGGRLETSWGLQRNVRAHETIRNHLARALRAHALLRVERGVRSHLLEPARPLGRRTPRIGHRRHRDPEQGNTAQRAEPEAPGGMTPPRSRPRSGRRRADWAQARVRDAPRRARPGSEVTAGRRARTW